MKKNYLPEIKSLLETAASLGITVLAVDEGGDEEVNVKGLPVEKIADIINSVDDSWVYLEYKGQKLWAWIVLGNSPGEIVCDHSARDIMDDLTSKHAAIWENTAQLFTA